MDFVYKPTTEFIESTNVWTFMQEYDIDDHDELIERACSDQDWFWGEVVNHLDIEFYEEYDEVRDDTRGPQFTEWYPGGRINIAHNAVDRQGGPGGRARDALACIWESEGKTTRRITYHELYRQSNRVANALEERGVQQGDTVGMVLPMIPEVAPVLYGCLKVGAIAVPVFSGFGADAIASRLGHADCSVIFTADGYYRRGEQITLKDTVDAAVSATECVEHTIVCDRLGLTHSDDMDWNVGHDEKWARAVTPQDETYDTTAVSTTHESMLLYTSGTTGRPKGTIQTHGGQGVKCPKDLYFEFDQSPGDRFYWLTNPGWMMCPWTLIGSHTLGGTVFMYEGAIDHPEPDRQWEMIDRHSLTTFGVSPTGIRVLRRHGEEWITGHDLSSLRLLGSTGESWDPDSWQWFFEQIGHGEKPIINVSGGTETGGHFLAPLPIRPLKPCTVGEPTLGMDVDIVDEQGESVANDNEQGYLVLRDSCPSMTKSLWDGDERYMEEYWNRWDNVWNHNDWAQKDEDGVWFVHGRADDVLNVAGRTVGPAEIEGVLIGHEAITEAAVIGVPDDITGEAIIALVVPAADATATEDLKNELCRTVGEQMGKPFKPQSVLFKTSIPKNQSGKILRRTLRKTFSTSMS